MAKSRTTRLREQRERQAEYRKAQKAARRPGRDDVGRIALRWLIVSTARLAQRQQNPKRMNQVEDVLLEALEQQGFDPVASDDVLEALIRKYTNEGWDFRRKPHLRRPDEQE